MRFLLLLTTATATAVNAARKPAPSHPADSGAPQGNFVPPTSNPAHPLPTSPPVLPGPPQMGNDGWNAAIDKATKYLAKYNWTVDEMVALATGSGWDVDVCEANTNPIKRVGFPGQCFTDGPSGLLDADRVSAFGPGINVAATFDRGLMRARSQAIGREYREKGVNVYLGPMTNIIRTPEGGRNWESFGADPYLAGEGSFESVTGIQSQGVQAVIKHFINNEQERNRTTGSSNVDDRTQHEIYLHPFLRAIQADVASVMASYNKINQTFATQNSKTLNGLLKWELGFNGYVLSDFFGTHSPGWNALNAGLDMSLPDGIYYFGDSLTKAVADGKVTTGRIYDMAKRILSAWYLVGQDSPDYPKPNFNFHDNEDPRNQHIDVQHDHWKIIREVGAASHVILKNKNNTLPLDSPRSLVMVGTDAGPSPCGPNCSRDHGWHLETDPSGVLAMGWGTGTAWFPYLVDPVAAIQVKAKEKHIDIGWYLDDYDLKEAQKRVLNKEVAIVFGNVPSGEDTNGNGDRLNLKLWHKGEALIKAVADVNPNTIVVLHAVGPVLMEEWINHPNITAVVWAGMQGQEVGNALVDVLWGDVNPSGRLPYTIGKTWEDYPAKITSDTDNWDTPQVEYTEGLLVDYRWFDAKNITPRFEFGFGLSYTTFEYSSLSVRALHGALDEAPKGTDHHAQGSSVAKWLHAPRYVVSVTVKNTGSRDGHEVPQLYLEFPEEANQPPKVLRGFDRVLLKKGEKTKVKFELSYYNLAVWDVIEQRWKRPVGDFVVHVGASSRDIRLSTPLDGHNQSGASDGEGDDEDQGIKVEQEIFTPDKVYW